MVVHPGPSASASELACFGLALQTQPAGSHAFHTLTFSLQFHIPSMEGVILFVPDFEGLAHMLVGLNKVINTIQLQGLDETGQTWPCCALEASL